MNENELYDLYDKTVKTFSTKLTKKRHKIRAQQQTERILLLLLDVTNGILSDILLVDPFLICCS